LRGTVKVNGVPAGKPGALVGDGDVVEVDDPAGRYVSRAALKLIAGLEAGRIEVAGKACLDLGASTGGFTQVLVERGAARVYAVDVGHGQLDARVASLRPVVSLEGVNARDLTGALIPEPIDLLVCDISFVSVTKVLEAALSLCRGEAVVLIKPQFEVGRERIGKGGIVSDRTATAAAIVDVTNFVEGRGLALVTTLPSPISGSDGNEEVVAVFRRP
jgi:23S rRNA (cytidine1920-2'-O)/16S rRNA (cytidine1409-2'-O)-methyltransferase